jgi:hypothetical protein
LCFNEPDEADDADVSCSGSRAGSRREFSIQQEPRLKAAVVAAICPIATIPTSFAGIEDRESLSPQWIGPSPHETDLSPHKLNEFRPASYLCQGRE